MQRADKGQVRLFSPVTNAHMKTGLLRNLCRK
jgi:hypothetical protein